MGYRVLLIGLAVCSLGWGAEWKLTGEDPKDLVWEADGKKVPAVSQEVLGQIRSTRRVDLVKSDEVAHAALTIPYRYAIVEGEPAGGVVLLRPGQTADALLFPTMGGYTYRRGVSQLSLHSEGFYFTVVAGSAVSLGTYRMVPDSATFIVSLPVTEIRSGNVKVAFEDDKAVVVHQLNRTFFDTDGVRSEGRARFHDLTLENQMALKEDFKATDLTREAELGRVESHPFYSSYVDEMMQGFSATGRSSVLLVDKHAGAQSEQVLHRLAQELASGKRTIFGEKGWKVYEVNWTEFGANGFVDVTVSKVNRLLNVARQKKVILYMPAIENLKDLGVTKSGEKKDATAAMLRDIETGRVIVIGKTDSHGWNLLKGRAPEFLRAFTELSVAPPEGEALKTLLADYGDLLERQYGAHLSEALVDEVIRLTNQFIPQSKVAQPQKSKDLMLAVARNPKAYLGTDGKLSKSNGKVVVSQGMVRRYLAQETGISTLAEMDDSAGLRKFTSPEVYFKRMDKAVTGHHDAKEAILRQLLLVADDKPLEVDANGAELGVPVILLLGPSGVGKSFLPEQLAKILAEYDVNWPWLPVELSAATDKTAASSLTGSRPGYVGFLAEGSKFVQMLRENPQALLVFEEIDKAHPTVLQTLYPFLERGRFQDAHLHNIRWTRGLVFLTSNFGAQGNKGSRVTQQDVETSDLIDQWDNWHMNGVEPTDPEVKQWDKEALKRNLISDLIDTGKISPQVIGRIGYDNVIILHHFGKKEITDLVEIFSGVVQGKFKENYSVPVRFTGEARALLVARAWGPEGRTAFDLGARSPKDLLTKQIYSKLQLFRRQPEVRTLDPKTVQFVLDAKDGEFEIRHEKRGGK